MEAEYGGTEGGEADAELDLSDDDSLPWLEAEEEDEGRSGVDFAQIIGLFLILATLAVAIVGAVWFFSNRNGDPELVADGSLIEAPEGPIKELPEDPGGKEFDGTGNVAPVVAEGGTREGVMNTDGAPEASEASEADAAQSESAGPKATPVAGVGVQLAAYTSRARAEQGWNDLRRQTDVLNGVRYRIEEGVVDIGTVYRLQAVAGDRASADQLCAALKDDGLDCQVKP